MESLNHGIVEVWIYISIEAWKHGKMEAWKLRCLDAWKLGSMVVWKHGNNGITTQSLVIVWSNNL